MIDIPPEIRIQATIHAGSVYYFPEDTFISDEPHYFILINQDPIIDEALFQKMIALSIYADPISLGAQC